MSKFSSTTVFRNIIAVPADTRQRFVQLEQEAAVPLTKLGVRLSGIGTFGPGYRVGYRDPSCHLMLLTLEGHGFYHSIDNQLNLSSGDLLFSPVGVPLLLGTLKRPWTFLWFYLNPTRPRQVGDRDRAELTRPSFAVQLHHALEGLLAETGYYGTQSVLTESGWNVSEPAPIKPSSRAANLFGELVAEYMRKILIPEDSTVTSMETELLQLWKKIEQLPGLDWTQKSISRQLGVSPATLQRLVRRLFDTTPQQWVTAMRMNHARRLLQQSDYPLSMIAREVGYSDAFVLSAAFKRFHGTSPQLFRERCVAKA